MSCGTVSYTHLAQVTLGVEQISAVVQKMCIRDRLIPDLMTLGEVQKGLQNLLREKISIKDRVTILETLADNARNTKDIELLTEYVRMAMSRSICAGLVDETNSITCLLYTSCRCTISKFNIPKCTNSYKWRG